MRSSTSLGKVSTPPTVGCGHLEDVHSPPASRFPKPPVTGHAARHDYHRVGLRLGHHDIGAQTTTPHRAGRASSHAAAWTAALRTARTALLAGELDTLAVTIGDDHCGALYAPARDQDGHINPDQLTAALIDLHQAATAAELADKLTCLTHMSS